MHFKEGFGEAIGHHGELLQGVFESESKKLHRGLVSLPCPNLRSKVSFLANEETRVSVSPQRCIKAKRAAELTLDSFAQTRVGGSVIITSNIAIGRGMGSSTADVVATILAVLDYLNIQASLDRIMQIAVAAETACDSTIFSHPAVLFAQREGLVIEAFKRPIPNVDLISIDSAETEAVDTLTFTPADYNQVEIEKFRSLRALLRQAINTSDLNLLGRVATASARINQRFLRNPHFDRLEEIGLRHGAIGVQVAHSGTVFGLMFDPADVSSAERIELSTRELRRSGFESFIVHT
ncbi:GHMP kinase (plasmid) [Cupriavidus taiwanensis]|uniref:GHMP kinase n=1 Tax=Cupriavidus taiwanensis TaxID=164546 RepID=A0A375FH21_9BURK|nr:GHMP kinase [Cupriavidus taiwanensis]SOZ70916.1 GHMP kinase [Cupriavidus taiwanensis]SOZ72116.1 GHMP kinase [Cupriavidus taiwanensis]SOZ74410.1 GHMP kinase [Cupriavidus taiwanensis]SPA03316.1 GHMP kinase [Cupriavidus taiwanensis]SPA11290.1 GHMP kinase [Cupriavidus taiwanensis]